MKRAVSLLLVIVLLALSGPVQAAASWARVQDLEKALYGAKSRTADTQPFLYTGQELDAETGWYHLRARHYAPKFGKFLARDPIASANLYSYCEGDPINFVDPSGLDDVDNRPGAPDDPNEIVYQQMRAKAIRLGYLQPDPPPMSFMQQAVVNYVLYVVSMGAGGLPELRGAKECGVYRATLGRSTSTNYRQTFFRQNPGLENTGLTVHHAVEQQVGAFPFSCSLLLVRN